MRLAETLIAWNGGDSGGNIAIGPLLQEDEPDWAAPYEATGRAAYVEHRNLSGVPAEHQVMRDYYRLVYTYGLHPYIVHRAFLLIDEYQAVIKAMGCGPDRGEPGHDPAVGFGRAVKVPLPELQMKHTGRATHFWWSAD
jgi:hypothetical protein